jgi:hypothetical protein
VLHSLFSNARFTVCLAALPGQPEAAVQEATGSENQKIESRPSMKVARAFFRMTQMNSLRWTSIEARAKVAV